jgi:hypothetical protein
MIVESKVQLGQNCGLMHITPVSVLQDFKAVLCHEFCILNSDLYCSVYQYMVHKGLLSQTIIRLQNW